MFRRCTRSFCGRDIFRGRLRNNRRGGWENKKAGQWFTEIQRSRKRDLLPLGSPDAPDKDLEPGSWTQTHCSAKCLLARFVGWARESCSPVIHSTEGKEGTIL